MQRASEEQKNIMRECYGKNGEILKISKVKYVLIDGQTALVQGLSLNYVTHEEGRLS